MKTYIAILVILFSISAHAGTLDTIPVLSSAPDESDKMLIRDGATDKSITTLYLMRLLEGTLTDFEIHADNLSVGGGTVDTFGLPIANDFARFTDENTIEGRSYSDVRSDLGLVIGTNVLAEQTIGIADNYLLEVDGTPIANEYARFTSSGIEGRNEAEFKVDFNLEIGTDVLAEQTIGIADNNLTEIDDADAADNDYAKLTASGIEGRSYAEVKTDLTLDSVENTAISTWAGSSNITTVGTLSAGDATAVVTAATDSASGKVELATIEETTTGTDATKAVTPDGLHDMTSLSGAAWMLNENDMVSNSSTKVASQASVKQYVDDSVFSGIPDGDKGDVTVSGSGTIVTIDNSAVTYAKMQDVSATDKVLGRETAGSGVVEEIDLTAFGRSIIDDVDEATFKATVNLEIGTDVLAQQTIGIADNYLLEVDGTPLTTEYARFTANGIEGRTPSEVRGDLELRVGQEILAYQAIGIADDNLLEVDDAAVADNDYAKFTANGLEGQTYAQVRADINVADGADVTGDNAPQAHAASHLSAGGDAIKIDDLAAPDDNTDLDVSTSAHGLVPKGTNTGTAFLRDDATWAVPAGSGDVAKVGTPVDNEIGVWTGDGTLEGDTNFAWDSSALIMLGTVFIKEQADAAVDKANYGQIWVKTGTPNKLYFTDGAGTDFELGSGAGTVDTSGTPADNEFAKFTDADTIEGRAYADVRTDLGLVIGTDVLAEQAIGIADDNLLEVDATDGAPADNEYARFTTSGLEGRTEAEFKGDFNLEIGVDAQAYNVNLTAIDQALTTASSPQFAGIELSHATLNTLTAAAGVLSIEGNALGLASDLTTHAGAADPHPIYRLESEMGTAANRDAEDTLTDGANLPDGAAIKAYGDANWGAGSVGTFGTPADNEWARFTDATTIEGLSDADTRTALSLYTTAQVDSEIDTDIATHAGLSDPHTVYRLESEMGTAANRAAEDTLTDGSNLPDGAAIKAYGDANWNDAGGDVTAAANMTDHTLVRGDGGAKGVQDTGIAVDNSDNMSGAASYTADEGTSANLSLNDSDGNNFDIDVDGDDAVFKIGGVTHFTMDGATDQINVDQPLISSAEIKAVTGNMGTEVHYITAAYNIESSDPNVNHKVFYINDISGEITITLPNEPTSDAASTNPMNSKYFRIMDFDTFAGDDVRIAAQDQIVFMGEGGCGAGKDLECGAGGAPHTEFSVVDFYGYDAAGTDYWLVIQITGVCECEP